MNIRKYEAESEVLALEKISEELGDSALILNVRSVKSGGVFGFLKKPFVEVTVAFDEDEVLEKQFDLNKQAVLKACSDVAREKSLEKEKVKDKVVLGKASVVDKSSLFYGGDKSQEREFDSESVATNVLKALSRKKFEAENVYGRESFFNNLEREMLENEKVKKFEKERDEKEQVEKEQDKKIDEFATRKFDDNYLYFSEKKSKIKVLEEMVKESGEFVNNKKENVQSKIIDNDKFKVMKERLNQKEKVIAELMKELAVSKSKKGEIERKYENNILEIFHDALVAQGVEEKIAEEILDEVDVFEEVGEGEINFIVKNVYNRIVEIIGDAQTIEFQESGKSRVIAFIGSTGVGKTTTIAKLSARFILRDNLNVGLVTADTYRIAATEQLRVYGDILGVDVQVVYGQEDLSRAISALSGQKFNPVDLIMLDTAGRSHKNEENFLELKNLLSVIPECEKMLVLSLTTKTEDLIDIVKTYEAGIGGDFRIIFTKLDETLKLGTILNVCYKTGKKISYVTMGQNVPEDIEELKAEKVARGLLMGATEDFYEEETGSSQLNAEEMEIQRRNRSQIRKMSKKKSGKQKETFVKVDTQKLAIARDK